jgi:hypothetical protein
MSGSWYLFTALALMLFVGCEFTPGDIPERFTEKPSETGPALNIRLTPESDTLFLDKPVTITYQLASSGHAVHWVEIYWNDKFLYQREYELNETVSLNLDIYPYPDGLHTLQFRIFAASNSGSIADKLKAEGYLYTLSWPVVIDRTPARPLSILKVEPVSGGVMVYWEKFTRASFNNYMIHKTSDFETWQGEVARITNRYDTQFFDADYVDGEKVKYQVYLNGIPGPVYYYSEQPVPPVVHWEKGFAVSISWKPTRNPARLNYYRLFQNDLISPRNVIHIPFEGESAHLVLPKTRFGTNIVQNLQYVPKANTTNISFWGLEVGSTPFAIGYPIPAYTALRKIQGTNLSIMSQDDRLLLYDHEHQKSMDSIDFRPARLRAFRVSSDGKLVYVLAGNTIEILEPVGFKLIERIDLEDIDAGLSSIYDISVSDNRQMLFTMTGFRTLVYDFNQKKTILNTPSGIGFSVISPSGDKIMAYGDLQRPGIYYQIGESGLAEIGRLPQIRNHLLFTFSKSELNHILLFQENLVEVRDASDFSLISQLDMSYNSLVAYDHGQNRFVATRLTSSGEEGYLLQLPYGEVSDTLYVSTSGISLHNNFLVSKIGRQLNLDELKNPK